MIVVTQKLDPEEGKMKVQIYSAQEFDDGSFGSTVRELCVDGKVHVTYAQGYDHQSNDLKSHKDWEWYQDFRQCDKSCMREVVEIPESIEVLVDKFLAGEVVAEKTGFSRPHYTAEDLVDIDEC